MDTAVSLTWFPCLVQAPVFPPPPSFLLKSVPVSYVDEDISLLPSKGSAELMLLPLTPQLQLQWLNPSEGELRKRKDGVNYFVDKE